MGRVGSEERERLHQAMMAVVDTQLKENDPPETRATLNRLVEAGHQEGEARRLIAGAVVEMTVRVMRGHDYDHAAYVEMLERLPTLPWE